MTILKVAHKKRRYQKVESFWKLIFRSPRFGNGSHYFQICFTCLFWPKCFKVSYRSHKISFKYFTMNLYKIRTFSTYHRWIRTPTEIIAVPRCHALPSPIWNVPLSPNRTAGLLDPGCSQGPQYHGLVTALRTLNPCRTPLPSFISVTYRLSHFLALSGRFLFISRSLLL